MKVNVYLLKCLTNLHMGSGDVNYNVIDLEVERDPVTGQPTMNASGVKGAIRDFCENHTELKSEVEHIFGTSENNGRYKFFSGDLLGRPVRVTAGKDAYVIATTPNLINDFVEKVQALGGELGVANDTPEVEEGKLLSSVSWDIAVEGKATVNGKSSAMLTKLLGDKWVVGDDGWLKTIDLPVMAHNVLDEKKKSTNLWFEEYVPHESVFGLIIMSPKNDNRLDEIMGENPVIQFGAEASTGCGYVQLTKVV